MTAPAAVTVEQLNKHFGPVKAVNDLSFTVRPGAVTGFLGPNGAGKTTTLRMLLGLVRPTSGRALIGGVPYTELERPAQTVGAALEASAFHPGRSGLDHLRMFAPQVGVPDSRCHELLELVGLDGAKKRRVGGYSMGMRQRLALAYAMLGDPAVVILDEPANGLDPQGIVWLRQLLRAFADQGKTVLVSSHVLGEVQSTVDDVVIIAGGRLVHESSLHELGRLAEPSVEVASPALQRLTELAQARHWRHEVRPDGTMLIHDVQAPAVGAAAFAAGVELHRLADVGVGLEDVFLRLTGEPTQGVAR